MKNKKYYPFERNNYFYGKLLTVRDFEDEQKYMNDKRRIHNILTSGAGIVGGLHTLLIDDKTISVEAGMALDYQGREIIVEESVTKKLNVIDGFEELEDFDHVYLGLEYAEQRQEMIHSIARTEGDGDSGYNRILEGYHLFLTDRVNEDSLFALEELKTVRRTIFYEEGMKILQDTPRYIKANSPFEIKITIEKNDLPQTIEIDYMIEADFFKTSEGKSDLRVYHSDNDSTPYKKVELRYQLMARENSCSDAFFSVSAEASRISIGGQHFQIDEDKKIPVSVIQTEVKDAVIFRYYTRHFYEQLDSGADTAIYLAKLRLIKRKLEYSIIDFEWLPFRQYVLSNAMLSLFMEDTPCLPILEQRPAEETQNERPVIENPEKRMASGSETIGIEVRSRNKVYFSDEIVHGLGKGDVYITAAVEERADRANVYDQNKVYFGACNILKGSIFEGELPQMELAVISYTERGTFRIAVKILENVNNTLITVKWWAMRSSAARVEDPSELGGVFISITPDTLTLMPREKFKFNAEVSGTDNQECRWSITEENGGQIDRNGLYEAPTHPGVYEITAESVKYPNRKATAFVVVKEG